MLYLAGSKNAELHIVAIGPMHNAYTLDLLRGEGFNLLLAIAHEAQPTNPTPIGEGDMPAIRIQFPAGLFVLDGAIVVLKLGIAFLARFLLLAILIEARDGSSGPISTGLTGLRIEAGGKRILLGKHSTITLEIILAYPALIHPEAQALITDELCDPYRLINGGILLFGAVKLVLKNQHLFSLPLLDILPQYPDDHAIERAALRLCKLLHGRIHIGWIACIDLGIFLSLHSTILAQK